jgi:hypothetical protein
MRLRTLAAAVLALATIALARPARADLTCEPPPRQTAPRNQIDLSKVKVTLLGRTTVNQRIVQGVDNLYAAYPNADRIVVNLHAIYIVCQLIRDSNFPPDRKLAMLQDFMHWSGTQTGPPKPAAPRPATRPAAKEADPPWAAYRMTAQEAAKAVTADEAKAKPWCVPSFPDRYDVTLYERDRFLYYGAAQAAMKANGKLLLVGYVFETGMGREYSLALGQRRANAVKDMFAVMGVPADTISTVSVGHERPMEVIGSRYCGVIIQPEGSPWGKPLS